MSVDRVKFQDIVESQLPRYVSDEFPLLPEFLKQYYISQEFESGTLDIVQNLDQYVKLDQIFDLSNSTVLRFDIGYTDTTIETSYRGNFTDGFPDNHGLIQIDDEIIYYRNKTDNTFEGCVRGFSGISSYISPSNPEQLVFGETESQSHSENAEIKNLNVIFLQEFFKKIKRQIAPGFDDRNLATNIDQRNLIFGLNSFYGTKGTDESFRILFGALYGSHAEIIRPSDFLFRPSDADYRVTEDMIVEQIEGNPLDLQNETLIQTSTGAKGTITKVEPIAYDKGQYYQVGIDLGYDRDIDVRGSKFADFKLNSKTRILNNVAVGATILDVDSTVGFAQTGNLTTTDVDGDIVTLSYDGKSINQFINVEGVLTNINEKTDVREDGYSYATVGLEQTEEVRVRVAGGLNDFSENETTNLIDPGDPIVIKSMGIEQEDLRSRGWFTNIKTTMDVELFNTVDEEERIYEIFTYDDHYYYPGVRLLIYNNAGLVVNGTITRIAGRRSFIVRTDSKLFSFQLGAEYKLQSEVLKTRSSKYPKLNEYITNVQNTYSKFSGETLVASNSIPSLLDKDVDPNNRVYTFTGSSVNDYELKLTDNTDHGFYTGDAIFYERGVVDVITITPDGNEEINQVYNGFDDLEELVYYVYRVDQEKIKLARSKSDIFANKFIALLGEVENNVISDYNFYSKVLTPQQIVRRISDPYTKSGNYPTQPDFYNGILLNGVEILNYKSTDKMFHGSVTGIDIDDGGDNFDVITPPLVHIEDTEIVGSGATGTASVVGNLREIRIIDSGFDYLNTPVVSISGGSGEGASAEVNMMNIKYSISFNAGVTTSPTGGITTSTGIIGFSTFHKFRDNEQVVYETRDQQGIVGLVTSSLYYVKVLNGYEINLHKTFEDSNLGINTITMQSLGDGIHEISSVDKKKIVSNVVVTNSGSEYKNRERKVFLDDGVNTGTDTLYILNHGYKTGEIVNYSEFEGKKVISGLSTNTDYYVSRVDNDHFQLSELKLSGNDKKYNLDRNIFVDLRSRGTGFFNYKPIVVSVDGLVGVSTLIGQDFGCKVQPIFRGGVDSIDMTEGGEKYGSDEILNFNRSPVVRLKSGENCILQPVVSVNGQIVDVIIIDGGSQYFAPPELIVVGEGVRERDYARLTPITDNGRIVDVVISHPGSGYEINKTSIRVANSGDGYSVSARLNEWGINRFAKDFNIIDSADNFISENNDSVELQISNIYPPREFRESLNSLNGDGTKNFGRQDLLKRRNVERTNNQHSPILGWAYDGNPIYGPYGFKNGRSGVVSQMRSGYILKDVRRDSVHRPSRSLYPGGFFLEDYFFANGGDLDTHNGRFCVTPDYPNGTYAYFTTFTRSVASKGPFKNFKTPVFPYVVGDTFKYRPDLFNFAGLANQSDFDIELNGWFRNTQAYHLNDDHSDYDFVLNSNDYEKQSLIASRTSKGFINGVGIVTGGNGYQIGDKLSFNNTNSGGKEIQSKVSLLGGKRVVDVRTENTSVYGVEFVNVNKPNTFIGFSSDPHNLRIRDVVVVSGISSYIKGFDRSYTIGVTSESFFLNSDISATGSNSVEYFPVSGPLVSPSIRANDILGIGTEKVKVLNVEPESGRIRVVRRHDGTVGAAHTLSSKLIQDSRKFTITSSGLTTSRNLRANEEFYFIPSESVGVGTIIGVGTTVSVSNPGAGVSTRFLTPRSIFIPKHQLKLNDRVVYNEYSNNTIQFWNGVSGAPVENLSGYQYLYVAPLTDNTIGLSTQKVGYGTDGSFIGINSAPGLMYFTNFGNGTYQSIKSDFEDVLKAEVSKNLVNVSTAKTHGVSYGDIVNLTLKPLRIKEVSVKYNPRSRRIIFDSVQFTASDVDLIGNKITITNHVYVRGDKVLYLTNSAVGGIVSGKTYFAIPFDENTIQLVENKFEIEKPVPNVVNFTSTGNGTLSLVNPLVKVTRNETLKFNLSDPSLAFASNDNRYSAFEMNLFIDNKYLTEYNSSSETREFEVTRVGKAGFEGAELSLFVSDFVPQNLWYNFERINLDKLTRPYREYHIDVDVISHNQIFVEDSVYSGTYGVVGVGSTMFQFNLNKKPETLYFDQTSSSISYTTKSKTAYGGVADVNIINPGYEYQSLPGITSVRSKFGSGAILLAQSDNIGNILKTKYASNKIGFDYPTDQTMRVVSNVPEVVSVNTLASFTQIGIASQGRNYLVAPNLVVVDGFTNEVVKEIELRYTLGDSNVEILTNTYGLYPTNPRIVPINNSNGVGINSAIYNSTNKTAQVFLNRPFKTLADFPFQVNDLVFIENTSVGISTTGSGYNSSDYSYQYFPIVSIDPNIGGSNGSITYDMSDMIDDGEVAGNYDISGSIGNVVPVNQFPIFKPEFKKNNLLIGEIVDGSFGNKGTVVSFNPVIELAKISTKTKFEIGEVLTSRTSGTVSIVTDTKNYDSEITTTPGSEVINGWETEVGFMNNSLQRLPNNKYYQNFSYSVSSEIPFDQWDDSVSSIAHPAGVEKFSDLQVVSIADPVTPIIPDANVEITVDLTSDASIWAFQDFDSVSERTSFVNGGDVSREIYFENRILTDHFECIGNRVTNVDDFSDRFNSDVRDTNFIDVGQFQISSRFNRLFAYVVDTTFTEERQFSITSFVQDGTNSYQQEYGTLNTNVSLGFFDWIKNEDGWTYRFFPGKPLFNSYNISIASIGILDQSQGIGTDRISVESSQMAIFTDSQSEISIGSSGTIVSYGTSYRSAKSRILMQDSEGFTHGTEITTIHDGTNVGIMKFGDLVSTPVEYSYGDSEIGTFDANIVGSNVEVTFTPNAGVGATVFASNLLMSATEVGVGSDNMLVSRFVTNYVSISASATPTTHDITSYGYPYSTGSYVIQVSDTTNNKHFVTEAVALNNNFVEDFATFGGVKSSDKTLGTFDITTDSSNTIITFKPDANIDVEVRVFGLELQPWLGNDFSDQKNSDHTQVINSFIQYKGSKLEQNAQFNMNKDDLGIFIRNFRGNDSDVVGVGTNTVTIPFHLFETGDRVIYNGNEGRQGTSVNRIGIAETVVAGVSTNKMPRDVYVVKKSDSKIAFAETPEDALLREPKTFQITSVGIGTFHQVKSQKTDERTMVLIDNMIQSPLANTDISTQLVSTIETNTELRVVGITSFFSEDLVQIDDEYMLVLATWFDETDNNFYMEVVRGMMGSNLAAHSGGSTVSKVAGQYNIVENVINFVQSPKGNNPMSTTTEGPDEFDWTGITTHSSFQGRVFNRTSFQGVGVNTENYDKNHVFDDISPQFTGITSDFVLKYEGGSVTGISTDNAWVLINGVFQHPDGIARNGRDELPSYDMSEAGGETTIRFLADPATGDNNTQTYPRGGILMEIGSKPGFGYQPLVSAGGTVTVSTGGTVTAISIGNSGSGYRSGLQTVNISGQTYSDGIPYIQHIGIASIGGGHVVSASITNLDAVFKTFISRASTATYKGDNGLIKTAAVDEARFENNHLLFEESRTNLARYSSEPNLWTDQTAAPIVSIGNTVAPDGGLADKLTQQAERFSGKYIALPEVTTNTTYSVSGFIKPVDPATKTRFGVAAALPVGWIGYVDTSWDANGVPTTSATNAQNIQYVSYPNGWYKISFQFTTGASALINTRLHIHPDRDDNGKSIWFWGAQLEVGSFATSYIPTKATIVTRAADIVQDVQPEIVIDAPLPYDNIPLLYSSESSAGIGTGAKVDIVVGNGSSVIDFKLQNKGWGYGDRNILTIGIGGTVGIPTTGSNFSEFQIEAVRTQRDQFNSWYMGELETLDEFGDEFDGLTKTFNLRLGGEGVAVVSRKGSQIDVEDTLLVFINGILQEPARAYSMQGGSVLRFTEAPKAGDRGEVFFYKGTRDKDVLFRDILETVKEGDTLNITNNPALNQSFGLNQDDRVVTGINTIDSVRTTPYVNPGVTTDTTTLRPILWKKQLSDVVIDGEKVGKSRMHYEPNIFPFGYLIQSIGVTTTVAYIDSLKPLFDTLIETEDEEYQNRVTIVSQDEKVTGEVTVNITDNGDIGSLDIVNPGTGYTSTPTISIANPVDGTRAVIESVVQNQKIVGFNIIEPGSGYTSDNPPIVLVEPPAYAIETVDVADYSGDYGVVVGFGTLTSGQITQLIFDFFIPTDSWMRNGQLVSDTTTVSGIQTGDFFTVFNSNTQHSKGTIVSKEIDDSTRIGVSTQFINNIYQVANYSNQTVNVPGVGSTTVRRVFTNIVGFSSDGISFDSSLYKFDSTVYTMDRVNYEIFTGGVGGSVENFGEYSWGKIDIKSRSDSQEFNFYGGNGYTGLTTSTYIRRANDLKFKGYDVIDY